MRVCFCVEGGMGVGASFGGELARQEQGTPS